MSNIKNGEHNQVLYSSFFYWKINRTSSKVNTFQHATMPKNNKINNIRKIKVILHQSLVICKTRINAVCTHSDSPSTHVQVTTLQVSFNLSSDFQHKCVFFIYFAT